MRGETPRRTVKATIEIEIHLRCAQSGLHLDGAMGVVGDVVAEAKRSEREIIRVYGAPLLYIPQRDNPTGQTYCRHLQNKTYLSMLCVKVTESGGSRRDDTAMMESATVQGIGCPP